MYSPRTSEATAAPTAPQAASRSLPTLVSSPAALAVAAGSGGARPVRARVYPLSPVTMEADGDGGCGGVLAVDGHCEIKICSSQYRAFKLLAGSPNLVQHYQKNKENSHFRQNFPRFLRVFV